MREAVEEALALYMKLATLETIIEILELVKRELGQRGIRIDFTLGEPGQPQRASSPHQQDGVLPNS